LSLKQLFSTKIVRGRKPWSIASDVVFIGLIIMLLVPATRSILLSGVAAVRTLVTGTGKPDSQELALDEMSWSWTLTDQQGIGIDFKSFRGNVIFLNQWATWCPPCRAEMPSIERLYRDYGDRVKFVILTGEDPQKVKEYLEKQKFSFPVYFGTVSGTSLASRSIPSTVIISRAGEMVVSKKGAYNWNARKIRKMMDRLLGQKNKVGNSIDLPTVR
jgi:thiol-disulfide isomerase/thioredoxin